MNSFTEAYAKAREVWLNQTYAEDWEKFLSKEVKLYELLGMFGPDRQLASGLDQLRWKILKEKKGKRGDVVVDAATSGLGLGSVEERAAMLKFLWHLYLGMSRGGQDIWIYSPPKDYQKWIFEELSGGVATVKPKIEKTEEVYTWGQKDVMSTALGHALAAAQKAVKKLGDSDATTLAAVKRWFGDEDTTDDKVKAAVKTLLDGFKKLCNTLNSNSLVFSDEPLDRNNGGWKDFAFIRRSEKMDVVYIQGAFLKAAGSTGRRWLCVETIVHELSHRTLGTDDWAYDHSGLAPSKKSLTHDKALNNADSWGYFCVDLAGMLATSERTKVLKKATLVKAA